MMQFINFIQKNISKKEDRVLLKKRNLSKQLLKSVLTIYFVITIVITALHVYVDYSYTKMHIKDDLQSIANIFKPALQTALWDLNDAQLEAIADGALQEPLVYKIVVKDEKGKILVKKVSKQFSQEKIFDETLAFAFPIYQEFNNLHIHLADVVIYSDKIAIFNRLKVNFGMIVLNAFLKSTVLILLFIVAFRRRLERPLQSLTKSIERLDWEQKHNRVVNVELVYDNELSILQAKFNELLAKISSEEEKRFTLIEKQKTQLEYDVLQRTQELETLNEKLQMLAKTDTLTQLYNRSKIDETLALRLKDFHRHGRVFSVIMVDIDFFKKVNDEYGHLVGDTILKTIANILKENIRETDIVGRWGGEEFLIICEATTKEGSFTLAEHIRKIIETYDFEAVGHKTASFGVAQIEKGFRVEDLIKAADDALYEAKASGRNKSVQA